MREIAGNDFALGLAAERVFGNTAMLFSARSSSLRCSAPSMRCT